MSKRVKIEVQDDEGTRYTLALAGRFSKEKVMKVMELMEMMNVPVENDGPRPAQGTFFGKLCNLIETAFSGVEFSSSDVAREFEDRYDQPVRLATISTYLSRLAEKNLLRRQKFGASWVYRKVYLRTPQLADK